MASMPTTGQCIRRPGLGLLLVTGAGMALTRSGSDGLKLGEEWAPRQTEGVGVHCGLIMGVREPFGLNL